MNNTEQTEIKAALDRIVKIVERETRWDTDNPGVRSDFERGVTVGLKIALASITLDLANAKATANNS